MLIEMKGIKMNLKNFMKMKMEQNMMKRFIRMQRDKIKNKMNKNTLNKMNLQNCRDLGYQKKLCDYDIHFIF